MPRFDAQREVLRHLLAGSGSADMVRPEWFTEPQRRLLGLFEKHGAALSEGLVKFELRHAGDEALVACEYNMVVGSGLAEQAIGPAIALLNAQWARSMVVDGALEVLGLAERGESVSVVRDALERIARELPGDGDRLRPVDASDWLEDELPASEALVADLVDMGGKCELVGPSKLGKTIAVTQLAVCLAAGVPWLGMDIPRRRRVLVVQLEISDNHYQSRLRKTMEAMGLDPRDLKGCLSIVNGRGKEASMCDIERAAAGYEAVIIDPLYKVISGDENKAEDVKPVLAAMDRICERTGATVFFVHHQPKGRAGDRSAIDRGAGSGVISRDIDALVTMDKHENERDVVVGTVVRNYPPKPPFVIRRNGLIWEPDGTAVAVVQTSASRNRRQQPPAEQALAVLGSEWLALTSAESRLVSKGWSVRGAKAALKQAEDEGRLERRQEGKNHRAEVKVVPGGPPASV